MMIELGKGRIYLRILGIISGLVVIVAIGVAGWWFLPWGEFTAGQEEEFSFNDDGEEQKVAGLTKDEANVSINFNEIKTKAIEISTFEDQPGTGWSGDGVYDTGNVYEGKQSLQLISLDGKEVISQHETKPDFAAMDYVAMTVQVDNPFAYDTVVMDIGDKEFKNYYRYKFTHLNQNWNIVRISKDQFIASSGDEKTKLGWKDVNSVRFVLISRPNSIATVRFDMLQGFVETNSLFNVLKVTRGAEYLVSLYNQYGQNKLVVHNQTQGVMVAQLIDPNIVRDFVLATTVWPMTEAQSGIYFRGNYVNADGYYFRIAGDMGKEWKLVKKNGEEMETIAQGEMKNSSFVKNEAYGMMVEARGNNIKLFVRKSGEDQYTLLGEVTDDEFRDGGVGVSVTGNGWSAFDDIRYKAL